MNAETEKQPSFLLLRQLHSLYSLRSLLVAFALYLIVVPDRPLWLGQADQWLFAQVADEQQLALIQDKSDNAESKSIVQINLQDIWGTVESIANGEIFRSSDTRETLTPDWFFGVERVIILLSGLFLVFGLARLSYATGGWLVLGTATGLVIIQCSLLSLKSTWCPFGVTIQFLALGYVTMLLWLKPAKETSALRNRLHEVSLAHAQLLMQQGRAQEVPSTLAFCYSSNDMLDLAYQAGQQLEQKRQYLAALEVYQMILEKTARFKDVQERLVQLESANTRGGLSETSLSLAATMVAGTAAQLPILGRYQVERELGRGAMGVVYLGKDPKISRQVAIKTLNYQQFDGHQLEELRERFFREAEAAGRLSHPHIVTVYDVGEESGLAFIAMDFIEGATLNHHCRPDQLLPVETVYKIILQVAEALSYAHERHIIHRDIKPSNLIYNAESGQVKVSDFGIARISDESQTRTGHVMGSPIYMSPEQLKGSKITGAADIFSLGATFYQLLTGVTPFAADTLPELTIQIMSKRHRSARDIRKDLPGSAVRITNKALHKDPAKRYQSAGEMAEQIRKAMSADFCGQVA